MPDMLPNHLDSVVRQLHGSVTELTILNVSECVLVAPKRIVKRAGIGDRCVWEAP